MSLIGTFIFIGPIPAGHEFTGDGHVPHFTVPCEGDFRVEELGVQAVNEGGKVCGHWGLKEEGVVVLEEELDGEGRG